MSLSLFICLYLIVTLNSIITFIWASVDINNYVNTKTEISTTENCKSQVPSLTIWSLVLSIIIFGLCTWIFFGNFRLRIWYD